MLATPRVRKTDVDAIVFEAESRRQEAAAKQLSLLPPSIDAAVNVLMTSNGLTADVDDHVAMKCWKCKGTGHIGRFCNKKPQSEAKKPEKKAQKPKNELLN